MAIARWMIDLSMRGLSESSEVRLLAVRDPGPVGREGAALAMREDTAYPFV
jgi:hypothetical protein